MSLQNINGSDSNHNINTQQQYDPNYSPEIWICHFYQGILTKKKTTFPFLQNPFDTNQISGKGICGSRFRWACAGPAGQKPQRGKGSGPGG